MCVCVCECKSVGVWGYKSVCVRVSVLECNLVRV